MKKVLVTGCSGYIGSHLCKLLENKYKVYGLDVNIPSVKVSTFYHENILNDDGIGQFDAVVHLAALTRVGESVQYPTKYYNTNLNGTINVLNNVSTANFIFASTGAAEGCGSPYGISKRAAEEVVKEMRGSSPYTIFRFYNVIGREWGINPTNPDGLMYNLMTADSTKPFTIYGNDYKESKDGTCIRDYVHVLEICNAIELAIERPSNSIECLGTGVGHTVNEIVNLFKQVNKRGFEVVYGPRRDGDLPVSVLKNVSPYMKKMYSFEELLKLAPIN
jgi:UDP-glucose 4-epimerase